MMPHSPILIKEILFHNNKDQLCKKAELLKRQYHNNNAQTTTYARPMGHNTQAPELQVLRGSWWRKDNSSTIEANSDTFTP